MCVLLPSRVFLLCVWVASVQAQTVQGTACTPVAFTVHTRRTTNGQWQAEVDVRHGAGLHDVVVAHHSDYCRVAESSVHSKTTITAVDETASGATPRWGGCPRPSSPSVEFTCGSSGPCKAHVPAGTSASMTCKPGYIMRRASSSKQTTCLNTGNWSEPLLDCMKEQPGYEFFPKLGWYQLYMIGNTFQQAKRVCEFDGGSLGVVDSPGELEVFTSLINRSRTAVNIEHEYDIYVGVSRRQEGAEYLSIIEGRPMTASYHFKWCPGRPPSTKQFGNCVIFAKQMLCHWDSGCERKLPFLCEISLDGRD